MTIHQHEALLVDQPLNAKHRVHALEGGQHHGMLEGPDFAAAEWMSGWIALSFLDDPLLAKDHFENFYNNVGYPISVARGAYWIGRTYKKLGNSELSKKWFKEASTYLTTYYGQLAFLKRSASVYQPVSDIGFKMRGKPFIDRVMIGIQPGNMFRRQIGFIN